MSDTSRTRIRRGHDGETSLRHVRKIINEKGFDTWARNVSACRTWPSPLRHPRRLDLAPASHRILARPAHARQRTNARPSPAPPTSRAAAAVAGDEPPPAGDLGLAQPNALPDAPLRRPATRQAAAPPPLLLAVTGEDFRWLQPQRLGFEGGFNFLLCFDQIPPPI